MNFDLWQESRQGDGTGGSLGSILLREEPADYPGRVVVKILRPEFLHLRLIHFTTRDLRNEVEKVILSVYVSNFTFYQFLVWFHRPSLHWVNVESGTHINKRQ